MGRKYVTYAVEENIAIVTLNNPPMNALSLEIMREMDQVFTEMKTDDSIRAVILTGAGKVFCAGGEIREFLDFDRIKGEHYVREVQDAHRKITEFDLPVIAAINGHAVGGGCEISMSCDIRIASEKARFGLPELKLGVMPAAGGTKRLPWLIPMGKAKMLIFTGDHISAAEAERIGLVDKVVPAGEELNEARNLAKKMMKVGPVALRFAKKSVNRGKQTSLNDALMLEATLFGELFETQDVKEGVNAFLEKREPAFKGK